MLPRARYGLRMTAEHLVTIHGTPVMVLAPDGLPLDTEGAATEILGEAFGLRASTVVIPAERLTDGFFELKTGLAGEIVQKFATYQVQLVIVGDIVDRVADSTSLNAWVSESNRGRQLWFTPTFDEFTERLQI